MLSLPLLPPPDDNTPWLRDAYRPRPESPPPAPSHAAGTNTAQGQLTHQQRQQRQQRDEEKRLYAARSPLSLLAADEAAIAQRKASIRNFGAYWIRPPGISKTLQSMIEEEVERREQEELERQEQGVLDLQAQQAMQDVQGTQQTQDPEAQQGRPETTAAENAGQAGEERDLDDDVPEAEAASAFSSEASDDEENSHTEGHVQHVYEELEEAELTGVIRDEEQLGIEHERNLDDSVPEAISYQHTDSEPEHSTSDSEVEDSFVRPPHVFDRPRVLQQALGHGLPRSPGSMTLSSPHIESSFAASSPARARAARNTRLGSRRE